jgi:ADP-ribose pyrophosphatase
MEQLIKVQGSLFAKHFSAHLDLVRLRNGKATERIRIEHPEAAAVVPFAGPATIVMVRQWRYAIARETLEIPAGKVDPGEDAATCAVRELIEETGYRPERLHPLFSYYPAIGYSNEVIRIYAAAGLERQSYAVDEDEISKVELVPLDRIFDLISDGLIQDGKTVIGISMVRAQQERGELPAGFFA